jgi:hypothetical protein
MATIGQIGTATVLAASITFSAITFTGGADIQAIKDLGAKWKQDITEVVGNTIGLKENADLLRQDAISKINSKVEKINELHVIIQNLYNQIGSNVGDIDGLEEEVLRLEGELKKANDEILALRQQFGVLDSEITAIKSTSATASDVAITVDGTVQETATPTGPNTSTDTETETEPPIETEPVVDEYATQEASIKSRLQSNYPTASDIVVTMTDSTVTISSTVFATKGTSELESHINAGLYSVGKTVTYASGYGTNTLVFNIN